MSGTLTFDATLVAKLIQTSLAASEFRATYGQTGKIPPGLHFVGDDGIYLMSNAANQPKGADGKLPVVYAKECDPTTMEFDAWWAAKNDIFGGDDGVEFLPVDDKVMSAVAKAQPGDLVKIKLGARSMAITFVPKGAKPARKAAGAKGMGSGDLAYVMSKAIKAKTDAGGTVISWKDLADAVRGAGIASRLQNWMPVRNYLQGFINAGLLKRVPDPTKEEYLISLPGARS